MAAGVCQIFFSPPCATLICDCSLDADAWGMEDLLSAQTGMWQECLVRICPLPLNWWCLYVHFLTLGK